MLWPLVDRVDRKWTQEGEVKCLGDVVVVLVVVMVVVIISTREDHRLPLIDVVEVGCSAERACHHHWPSAALMVSRTLEPSVWKTLHLKLRSRSIQQAHEEQQNMRKKNKVIFSHLFTIC